MCGEGYDEALATAATKKKGGAKRKAAGPAENFDLAAEVAALDLQAGSRGRRGVEARFMPRGARPAARRVAAATAHESAAWRLARWLGEGAPRLPSHPKDF